MDNRISWFYNFDIPQNFGCKFFIELCVHAHFHSCVFKKWGRKPFLESILCHVSDSKYGSFIWFSNPKRVFKICSREIIITLYLLSKVSIMYKYSFCCRSIHLKVYTEYNPEGLFIKDSKTKLKICSNFKLYFWVFKITIIIRPYL